MKITRRRTPPASAFLRDLDRFYYWDSYEAPLRRGDLAMHEIYLALFAHHPRWAKRLLILRGRIVALLGLKASTAADLDNIEIKPACVGRREDRALHPVRTERHGDRHRWRR